MSSKLFRFFIIFLSATLIIGCKAEFPPEWRLFYTQAEGDETRVEWLSTIAVDVYGDVLSAGHTVKTGSNRQVNILLVKHDENGDFIWSTEYDIAQGAFRSDDKTTDMVLDDSGNAYLVGVQNIVENNQGRSGSFLTKIDQFGDVLWTQHLSDEKDAQDIEISDGKLYVTGHATQVFDLDGLRLLNIAHPNTRAWDIEVDDAGNMYVAGHAATTKYDEEGAQQWSVTLPEQVSQQASIAINSDGSVVIAHNQSDRSTRIAAISYDGTSLWNKTYSPAKQSYGVPGPALVKTDWRGDIILARSNDKSRRIIKLNANGRELWKISSTGIIQAFIVDNDRAIFAVGGGINEKYKANGDFSVETTQVLSVQTSTGSIVKSGEDIYIGYSAANNGKSNFYLEKHINQ
ncbi:MAG: hypothetical protein ACI84K_000138 [Pseudohongiellaceae bacterium]|jgi:hypothetical protein